MDIEHNSEASVGKRLETLMSDVPDGWAGAGSLALPKPVVADVVAILPLLPAEAVMPEVEVDPECGTVTLSWMADDMSSGFSLVFVGNGCVVGVMSGELHMAPWKLMCTDLDRVRGSLIDPVTKSLVTGVR